MLYCPRCLSRLGKLTERCPHCGVSFGYLIRHPFRARAVALISALLGAGLLAGILGSGLVCWLVGEPYRFSLMRWLGLLAGGILLLVGTRAWDQVRGLVRAALVSRYLKGNR